MWIWVSNLLEVLQLPKSPYFEGEGGDGGPAVDGLRAHGYLFFGGGGSRRPWIIGLPLCCYVCALYFYFIVYSFFLQIVMY
jgi:hypothetical protein